MPRLDIYPGFITKKTSFNPFMEVRSISEADLSEAQPKPALSQKVDPFFQKPEVKEQDPFSFQLPVKAEVVTKEKGFTFLHKQKPQQTKVEQASPSTRPMAFDQPRGKDGERLLYMYPNLPIISLDPSTEFTLLVGNSDKSATAWLMQFDGAANPNPGPASSGAVLWSPKDASGYRSPVFEMGKFLGKATNNLAEIQGLLLGLKMAAARGARELLIEGDSELIIRQQTREYKVSNKNLKSWWAEIQAAMMDEVCFDWIAIRHVRREFNERADSITKEVLSKREGFTRCG